jgi:hypothetical protein
MPPGTDEQDNRRRFLKSCGRFAAVTPPAITLLLSTSLTSTAIARSGGAGVGYGGGKDSFLDHLFDNDPDDPSSPGDRRNRGQDQQSSGGGAGGQSSGGGGGGQSSGDSGDGQSTAHSGSQGFGGSQAGLGGSASSHGNGGNDDKWRKGKKGPDR